MNSVEEIQQRLLNILSRLDSSDLTFKSPTSFTGDEHLLVGLDTNILKILRQNPAATQELTDHAGKAKVSIILPGQAATEYWNNYATFTREDLAKARKSAQALEALTEIPEISRRAKDILDLLDASEVHSIDAAALYNRSNDTIDTLLSYGRMFHVDRALFYPTALARQGSKLPPGFADDKDKKASLGDFYVWADFLYGSAVVLQELSVDAARVVMVTNDSKPDWRAGGRMHPVLNAECHLFLQQGAELWSSSDLNEWVSSRS